MYSLPLKRLDGEEVEEREEEDDDDDEEEEVDSREALGDGSVVSNCCDLIQSTYPVIPLSSL